MIRFNRFSSAAALVTAGMVAAGIGGAAPSRAETVPPHVPGRILVQFKPTATAEQVRSLVASANAQIQGEIPKTGVKVLKLSANANDVAVLRAFTQRSEVKSAELDQICRAQDTVPNDPWYVNWEWHLPKIGCPKAWDTTKGDPSIVVAVLDTGIDSSHPDLATKLVSGWNVFSNSPDLSDAVGHGTEVAGTIGASSNNASGVASVAWGCRIMPLKVTDGATSYTTFSVLATALTYAADHGARVANISFQCSESSTIASAAQYFVTKSNGVVAVSAGNTAGAVSNSDNPFVLTVSALTSSDTLASYSSYGGIVDIAAPGTVYTTVPGGGYSAFSGTSAAAPVVAGVAALVLSANPSLTGIQAQDILCQSSKDLGTVGKDYKFGWGRVDAAIAVATALSGPVGDTQAPSISLSNPADGATISGSIMVQASASDNVGISFVSLAVDGTLVATIGAPPYNFTWNSSTVSNGGHTLVVTASDAANNRSSTAAVVTVANNSDTSPPSVAIVSPSSISAVGTSMSVSVSAQDNVGVVKVELYVDGKLSSTGSAAPYSFIVSTRGWKTGSTHKLYSKAYDAARNTGTSAFVTVTK